MNLTNKLGQEWMNFLDGVTTRRMFQELESKVSSEYASHHVYPPEADLFRAFSLSVPCEIKVVIVGQDPYHKRGQANGLAFSVCRGATLPPSLRNILKEIEAELGQPSVAQDGVLDVWARQGVFLLNTTLTVREGDPMSHRGIGWEEFTDAVIQQISQRCDGVVFMLWGNHAQKKSQLINTEKHLVLESAHPSPLSACRGFFSNNHFSSANAFLGKKGKTTINW